MEDCKKKKIEDYVRSIPDFPQEGIIFRDVTSILEDADGFALAVDSMQKLLEGVDVDVIVGTESEDLFSERRLRIIYINRLYW